MYLKGNVTLHNLGDDSVDSQRENMKLQTGSAKVQNAQVEKNPYCLPNM